jgi:hypothetical protein
VLIKVHAASINDWDWCLPPFQVFPKKIRHVVGILSLAEDFHLPEIKSLSSCIIISKKEFASCIEHSDDPTIPFRQQFDKKTI